eukprot:Skav230524  [mRNA]  locus=scaffold1183:38211:43302:+ [translate_table: standard]
MMEARQYTSAGVIGGKIYVCGGWAGPQPVRSVECYDPASNRWSPMPPMLFARWGAGAGAAAVTAAAAVGARQQLSVALQRAEEQHLDLERAIKKAKDALQQLRNEAAAVEHSRHLCASQYVELSQQGRVEQDSMQKELTQLETQLKQVAGSILGSPGLQVSLRVRRCP